MYPEKKQRDKPWNGAYGDDDDSGETWSAPARESTSKRDTPMGDGAYGDDDED